MAKLTIEINEDTMREIKSCYGRADQKTVRDVVKNVLDRYLHTEYLDPEITFDENG